jgi:ribosome-binding protein aMBF1 (putative translation factor)
MDMNQLLYHHQLAKLNAQHSRSDKNSDTNFDLVGHYAGRIADWRRAKGLPEAGWPRDERPEAVNS